MLQHTSLTLKYWKGFDESFALQVKTIHERVLVDFSRGQIHHPRDPEMSLRWHFPPSEQQWSSTGEQIMWLEYWKGFNESLQVHFHVAGVLCTREQIFKSLNVWCAYTYEQVPPPQCDLGTLRSWSPEYLWVFWLRQELKVSLCLSVCPSVHSAQSSLEHLFFLVLAQSERKRVIRLRHTVGA